MLKQKVEFWILTVLATSALIVVLVNMLLFSQNRSAQAEVNSRGQFIQQSIQLEALYREIVKALVDLSVRNNDIQLRDILVKQGIVTVMPNPSPPAPAPGAAPDTKKGGK